MLSSETSTIGLLRKVQRGMMPCLALWWLNLVLDEMVQNFVVILVLIKSSCKMIVKLLVSFERLERRTDWRSSRF